VIATVEFALKHAKSSALLPTRTIALMLAMLMLAPAIRAADQQVERTEQVVEYLLDRGLLDEATALIKERLVAVESNSDRTRLLLRLAEIEYRSGDWQECLNVLDVAAGHAATADQVEDIADLRVEVAERLEAVSALALDPDGTAESSPESTDPTWADAGRESAAATATPLVSASFYELDLPQALLDLSLDAGIPIVWDRTVEGLVTFETIDTPFEDALAAIVGPSGYSFREIGGIYYVGSADPQGPAFARISQTVVMPLSNIAADEAVGLLSSHFRPYVQATTKSNNLVCITAPADLAARIREDLMLIDQPPPQVLIEVMVAEVRTDFLRAHGIDWLAAQSGDAPEWSVGTDLVQSLDASIGGDLSKAVDDVFGSTVDIAAGLRALVADGVAEIRASPRLTTLNGRPAQIGISQDQYFVIADGNNQSLYTYSRIEAVKASIAVQITPFVGPDGMLTLTVQPQVGDVVGEGEEGLPVIFNRSANTTIRVQDGETFSIGGLNTKKIMERTRRIPILGHIPLLGLLFRYEEHSEIESEVIIFVTPHVLTS